MFACKPGGVSVADCENDGNCKTVISVPASPEKLSAEPYDAFWTNANSPKKYTVELGPQLITNPQWPNPSIKTVSLSVARSAGEIAVRVEWEDPTKDEEFGYGTRYTDQIALMFPIHPRAEFPIITMGEESHPVNIWQWKAAWERDKNVGSGIAAESASAEPQPAKGKRLSPVQDLNAEGYSTLTNQEHQDVSGKGVWANNRWSVVFKRPLVTADANDVQFKQSLPMAIAVWDGGNRETNGQKGISTWILLNFN
jgi:DMSO reductase family type II enzyme heme b subunit